MAHIETRGRTRLRAAAVRGAGAALALTLSYALVFWIYAAVRSTATLVNTVNDSAGSTGTLIATGSALAIATLTIAFIFCFVTIPLGMAAAVLIERASARSNPKGNPRKAVPIGLGVTGMIAVMLMVLTEMVGLTFSEHFWEAWVLWFVAPLVIFIAAGGIGSVRHAS
jgi:hypothetical protein